MPGAAWRDTRALAGGLPTGPLQPLTAAIAVCRLPTRRSATWPYTLRRMLARCVGGDNDTASTTFYARSGFFLLGTYDEAARTQA